MKSEVKQRLTFIFTRLTFFSHQHYNETTIFV